MEEIDFMVDTSMGEIAISLGADGWAAFTPQDPGDEPILVEDIVRDAADVARCLETCGLPTDEAGELGGELWEELDTTEQAERARLPGRAPE